MQEVDKRSGYRTRQMLVVPVLDGDTLCGVLQIINNRSEQPFAKLEEDGARQLSKRWALSFASACKKPGTRNAAKLPNMTAWWARTC